MLLHAQTFRGGISGTVADTSGAVLAGAIVKLSGTDTGLSRETPTTGSGEFNFTDLPLGRYIVDVSQAGFAEQKIENVNVEAGRVFNLAVKLPLASQTTAVEVQASAIAIETSSSALTSVIPTKTILDVPLNGRDFTQLLKLNPGVNGAGSVNGTRTNSINWQIDGADNNDQWHNSAAVNQGGVSGVAGTVLPIDAIDEFSLQTNNSAENGRNGGGVLNVVIKSGTNSLHGSLYYFNRNDYLAARNWFTDPSSPTAKLKNNQEGGSLGGPIWKNHTFFFVTYEQQKFIAGNTAQDTIPSNTWVTEASQLLAKNGVPVNPVSLNLLNLWPAYSRTGPATQNNFFSTADDNYNSYNGIVKLDHIFNERNNIAIRYFGGTGSQTAYVGSALPDYYQVAPSRMHNFSFVYNRVISSHFVAQTLAGVNYFKQVFNDANTGFNPVALGLNTGVTNPSLSGAPDLTVSGFSEVGLTPPLGRIDTTGHLDQTFTYTIGSHQFRFGGEYRRSRLDVFYERNARGVFTFDGSQGPLSNASNSWGYTGLAPLASINSLADFLSGRVAPTNASITYGDLQRNYYLNGASGFFADSWKVSPKLTINYGLNYVYQSPISDPTDRISTFVPSKGGIVYPGQIESLWPRDWKDFGPRFGFAYQPRANGKLVVRGGYGVYYQVPNVNYFGDNRPGNGGATGILANPAGSSPVYTLSNPTSFTIQQNGPIFGSSTVPSGPFGAFSVSQHFVTAYVQNYNMNAQYQINSATVLEVGYTGSLSRHLPVTLDVNQIPIGQTIRPYSAEFPNLGPINEVQSVGNSHYDGAIVSLRTASFHGFTTKLNYTYGHSRDDLSSTRGKIPENSYNLRGDYGNSDFDVRHSFAGFISYTFGTPSHMKLLLGGWQLNSLLTFYTGQPFTVRAGQDRSQTGEHQDRAEVIGDPFKNVPADSAPNYAYFFNPAAFAQPAVGTYANQPRNEFYGPGTQQVDFSVFKNTRITERFTTQLRFEMFNVFNTRDLAPPSTSLSSSSLGQVSSTLGTYNGAPGVGTGEPRNIQLALKLIF